ncbi:hypothetical protein WJX72_009236 [[Myrmecia] bisecta]|uniref:Uncharacterized protein n=1 Tax=[Myrmecia] bisecta TaxID=41462 RepID=A0AAW1PM59_9CHLO
MAGYPEKSGRLECTSEQLPALAAEVDFFQLPRTVFLPGHEALLTAEEALKAMIERDVLPYIQEVARHGLLSASFSFAQCDNAGQPPTNAPGLLTIPSTDKGCPLQHQSLGMGKMRDRFPMTSRIALAVHLIALGLRVWEWKDSSCTGHRININSHQYTILDCVCVVAVGGK